jgi:hypothetical protein
VVLCAWCEGGYLTVNNIFSLFNGEALNDYILIEFTATWQQQKVWGKVTQRGQNQAMIPDVTNRCCAFPGSD